MMPPPCVPLVVLNCVPLLVVSWAAHVPRLGLFHLIVDAGLLRVFLRLRKGVKCLPIDTGCWRAGPPSQRTCDTGVVGNQHDFVFVCPALGSGHTMHHCLRSSPGLCALLWLKRAFCVAAQPPYYFVRNFTLVSGFMFGC
jgi:hypothetical protein